MENTSQSDVVGYAELQDLINACKAYSKGLDALPRFHEPILTRGETGIAVFRKVSPSVVMVLTANFKDDKVTESGLGTGVIIDPAGYVLTNWHVINGFESGIVFLKPAYGTEPDKNSAYGIKLIAESEQADLALLKIVKPPAGLVPVKLGDISSIQVAEDIHVIGHPHGQLWSYSTGVVSQARDNYDWIKTISCSISCAASVGKRAANNSSEIFQSTASGWPELSAFRSRESRSTNQVRFLGIS